MKKVMGFCWQLVGSMDCNIDIRIWKLRLYDGSRGWLHLKKELQCLYSDTTKPRYIPKVMINYCSIK